MKGLFPAWRSEAAASMIPVRNSADSLRVSPVPCRLILSHPSGSRLFPRSANSLELACSGKGEGRRDALQSYVLQLAPMASNAARVRGRWMVFRWIVSVAWQRRSICKRLQSRRSVRSLDRWLVCYPSNQFAVLHLIVRIHFTIK